VVVAGAVLPFGVSVDEMVVVPAEEGDPDLACEVKAVVLTVLVDVSGSNVVGMEIEGSRKLLEVDVEDRPSVETSGCAVDDKFVVPLFNVEENNVVKGRASVLLDGAVVTSVFVERLMEITFGELFGVGMSVLLMVTAEECFVETNVK